MRARLKPPTGHPCPSLVGVFSCSVCAVAQWNNAENEKTPTRVSFHVRRKVLPCHSTSVNPKKNNLKKGRTFALTCCRKQEGMVKPSPLSLKKHVENNRGGLPLPISAMSHQQTQKKEKKGNRHTFAPAHRHRKQEGRGKSYPGPRYILRGWARWPNPHPQHLLTLIVVLSLTCGVMVVDHVVVIIIVVDAWGVVVVVVDVDVRCCGGGYRLGGGGGWWGKVRCCWECWHVMHQRPRPNPSRTHHLHKRDTGTSWGKFWLPVPVPHWPVPVTCHESPFPCPSLCLINWSIILYNFWQLKSRKTKLFNDYI